MSTFARSTNPTTVTGYQLEAMDVYVEAARHCDPDG